MKKIDIKYEKIPQELADELVRAKILDQDFTLDVREVLRSLLHLKRENEYLLGYLFRVEKRIELKVYHYFKEYEKKRVRAAEVVKDLRITAPSASRALKRLSDAGLLRDHGGGVYSYVRLEGIRFSVHPPKVIQDILKKLEH